MPKDEADRWYCGGVYAAARGKAGEEKVRKECGEYAQMRSLRTGTKKGLRAIALLRCNETYFDVRS